MTRSTIASCGALVAGLALSLGTAQAVEITDVKKAPAWYASEVVETDQGKPVTRVVFSTQATAISMQDLNRILAAYGQSVVDAKRAPVGYMQEVRSGDRGDVVVTFEAAPKGMAPVAIDAILAAYGLRVTDAAKLPATYGTATVRKTPDGKDVQEILFSSAASAISPAEWHRILSAYGQ